MKTINSKFVLSCCVDSPVVMSVPHDGELRPSDLDRIYDRRPAGLRSESENTWQIVKDVNNGYPCTTIVRGLMPRTHVDYNRRRTESRGDHACGDERLIKFWREYHNKIRLELQRAVNQYGRALLLDVHGFINRPSFGNFDVILGTRHRKTISTDTDLLLAEFLKESGYKTYCPSKTILANELFSGGFTVRHHSGNNIDAIQVEIVRPLRELCDLSLDRALSLNLQRFVVGLTNQIRNEA